MCDSFVRKTFEPEWLMDVKSFRGLRPALAAVLACTATGAGLLLSTEATAASPPRIDLKVLVVTDGTPWVSAIHQQLTAEGVPTTVVDLSSPSRPTITSAYLSDLLPGGTPRAKFQGVVLPGEAPPGLSAAEQTALSSYEVTFGIRQVNSYVYPNANVGLNPPVYAGSLDGVAATATTVARSGAWRYLAGPVTFDGTTGGSGSYGYLATPLPADPVTGARFDPYLTAPTPSGVTGTAAGVYSKGGREQMVLSFAYNAYQRQFRAIAHGIVSWVTRGVHLGHWRNYFTTHIDDVFSNDGRWSDIGKCTPGAGECAPGVPPTTPIRMVPADVAATVAWQRQNNYTMDLLYNGDGSIQAGGNSDPLTVALLANKNSFRWVNHTFTHPFLGCVQDFTVIPWRCQTNAAGAVQWTTLATINAEISNNIWFANTRGLTIRTNELVAGEHSGTKILPQQPVDNPNLVTAMTRNGIRWLGLDASREPGQRQIGSALGLPRHPLNVFYNVATAREEVSEYNWVYTSRANGGSGVCENNATATCIAPLDPATGWSSYILPLQVRIALGYVLANDPQPFYMHQSNLAEDRLALQTLQAILVAYRGLFATITPVVNQTMTDAGTTLQRQTGWASMMNAGTVSGYLQGNVVTITGPAGTTVPVTAPTGTRIANATFGEAYGGEQSSWLTMTSSPTVLTLPSAPGFKSLVPAARSYLDVVMD